MTKKIEREERRGEEGEEEEEEREIGGRERKGGERRVPKASKLQLLW